MNLPRVTAIVPARNAERSLAACLIALRAEAPFEIIVVVDSSDDQTERIAHEHADRVLVTNRGNRSASRNAGIQNARGDLTAFVDADCLVGRGWLRALIDAVEPPWVAAAQSAVRPEYVGSSALLRRLIDAAFSANGSLDGETLDVPVIATGACLYRRSVFDRIGAFDEALPDLEDVDLTWRALAAGYGIRFVTGVDVREMQEHGSLFRFLRRRVAKGSAAHLFERKYASVLPAIAPSVARRLFSHADGRAELRVLRFLYRLGFFAASVRRRFHAPPPASLTAHTAPVSGLGSLCGAIIRDDSLRIVRLATGESYRFCDTDRTIAEHFIERRAVGELHERLHRSYEIAADDELTEVDEFVSFLRREQLVSG